MRIVGGAARGRRLRVPPAGTRPTSERAREALFDRLATLVDLDGARVLDLYAGSGAVGLEALSRGAVHVCFVESDRRAVEVLTHNVSVVAPDAPWGRTDVRRTTVAAFLDAPPPDRPFDLVFADPPYAAADAVVDGVLATVTGADWCVRGGLVVVERGARGPVVTWPAGVEALASKRYGEGVLWYGRRK